MESEPTPAMLANRRSLAVVPILVTLAAIGNTLVTMMLWNSNSEFFSSLGCGMLIAQPCLLSIWCALVKQKLILRVSFSMGILFGLYCTYMMTMGTLVPEMPLEDPLVCLGIVVALGVLIQSPLYVIRRQTGYVISTDINDTRVHNDNQFGIKHLLIATAVAAVLVAIAQASFSRLEIEGGAPWGEIIGFLVTIAALATLIVWMCLAVVFVERSRLMIGILLAGILLIGPIAVYAVLSNTVFRGVPGAEMYFNTLAFSIALAGTLLAVLFIFHAIGYRLHRVDI